MSFGLEAAPESVREVSNVRASTRAQLRSRAQSSVAYIHVGTHKTGTTSIQAFLSANESCFSSAGIFLPHTGRLSTFLASQPNIAWELTNDWSFNRDRGTLDELLAEVKDSGKPTVCISSEEFHRLYLYPDALARVADGFRAIGYTPRVILYLRPQADYAESLYGELLRGGHNVSFADFIDGIKNNTHAFAPFFDYLALLDALTAVFGKPEVIVRPYKADAPPDAILREFTALIGTNAGSLNFDTLDLPARLNERRTFELAAVKFSGSDKVPAVSSGARGGRFDPLTMADLVCISRRFARDNARVEREYDVRIPSISPARLYDELRAALGVDREAHERKRWFKASRALLPARTTPPI